MMDKAARLRYASEALPNREESMALIIEGDPGREVQAARDKVHT